MCNILKKMNPIRRSTLHFFCTTIFLKCKFLHLVCNRTKHLFFFSQEKPPGNFQWYIFFLMCDLDAGLKPRHSGEILQREKERVEAIYPCFLFPKYRFPLRDSTVLENPLLVLQSSMTFHYTLASVCKRFVEAFTALMSRNKHCDASNRSVSQFYFLVFFHLLDSNT